MYHGIIINKQFIDEDYPASFKAFAQKTSGDWQVYGIEISSSDLDQTIKDIQNNLRPSQPWYAHIYNNQQLIVIFKDKVIRATPDASSWGSVYAHAKRLNIPKAQLNLYPNKFQDEKHYFSA